MSIHLDRRVPRAIAIALLLINTITVYNPTSIQAQERTVPKQKLPSNDVTGKLLYQERFQTYYLHTPRSYKPDTPMPLVMMFHGSGRSGRSIASVTRFNNLAEQNGFIVVYPDGINHRWSQVRHYSSPQVDVDDAAFITALIEHLQQIRNIDRQRIYATGFSSGAISTQTLACKLSDRIAAFASVAGTLPANIAPLCQPKTPVSMLMINGTGDKSVPYPGGKVDAIREAISVPKTAELWGQHNSCAAKAKVEPLSEPTANSYGGVETSRYSGCHSGSEVMLVTVRGSGHSWPGSTSESEKQGKVNEINASQAIWNFFQRHALNP